MKEIKVFTSNISRDGEVRNEFQSFFQKLTDDDKILEEITWSAKNEIESKTVYEYDPKGRLVKELNYYDEEDFSDGRELTYNDNDQLEIIKISYADGSETVQQYERLPNLSRIRYYNEDNELEYTEERKFDERNNLLEFAKYGPANELEHKVMLVYDDHDRLSETHDFNYSEDFRSLTRIEYDNRNNIISEITRTEKGNVISSRTYTYNEQNEVVEEIVNDYTITFEMNDQGQRTERKITNQYGQLEELNTYVYDDEGRLLEDRMYKSSDLNKQDIFRTAYLRKRYEYT
jgi:hypothetical protein